MLVGLFIDMIIRNGRDTLAAFRGCAGFSGAVIVGWFGFVLPDPVDGYSDCC
jgi:hypothetical protein